MSFFVCVDFSVNTCRIKSSILALNIREKVSSNIDITKLI